MAASFRGHRPGTRRYSGSGRGLPRDVYHSPQPPPDPDLRAPVNTVEPRIHIIGVGSDGLAGLTARARELLLSADVVFGAEGVLDLLPDLRAERHPLGSDL